MSRFRKSRNVGHNSVGLIQQGMSLHLRMAAKLDEGQVKRIEFRSQQPFRNRGPIHELADQMMKEPEATK